MTFIALHDGWTLRRVTGPELPAGVPGVEIPATVPGCVHTDLMEAGVIPDPFVDDNEARLRWIGHTTWEYETSFDATPPQRGRLDLVCAGLDTIATITLNGTTLGQTQNMHRGYRFDTSGALRPGRNALRIRFDSAYEYANEQAQRLGPRPAAYTEPYNFIRKMACNFGWDWGPTLVTAGIWQPIGLDHWSVARLDEVRPLVRVVNDPRAGSHDGVVEIHVRLERHPPDAERSVVLLAAIDGHQCRVRVEPGSETATLRLRVPSPRLWWPRGYGEAARYPLEVTLQTEDGTELERWHRSIGFRDVRLDTAPDEHGSAYTLVVNDVPVFVRGANWIPDDPFPSRITRERLAHRIDQAAGANINLLRVWGGGRYESEDFYELADAAGMMVGQDFLFACAAYPEEQPFAQEVAAEAREQVIRLAPHPSLVWWTGNNENIWGFADWNWRDPLAGRSWGAGYYHQLLPRLVAELDPTRPYWPGSPYSGRPDLHPNDPAHGTVHIWDVWNTDDYTRYRMYRPRFVAEFGYQAPAAYATLTRVIHDAPLAPDSPGMRHHQKAVDGDRKLARGLAAHLPTPRGFDDWHYLTQVNQARAVQLGVEHFRGLAPLCMGAMVWQLNDCWPVTSWSAVDGDGRRKPLWYALRRAYADRLLTVQPAAGGLRLAVVNDGPERWSTQLDVRRVSLAGELRAKTTLVVDVPARASTEVPLPDDVARPDDAATEVLVIDDLATELRTWWFFAEDKDISYPAADFDAVVEPVEGALRVTVTARTFLRDLCLFPDRLDPTATVDEMLVTLLPGESAVFAVRAASQLDPVALTAPPVLRCVNDIHVR